MRCTPPAGCPADRFPETAFHLVPLAVLAVAALGGGVAGAGWSKQAAPLPWLVSLVLVGLPHGAADYALTRRVCRGWRSAVVWLAYAAIMAMVAAAFRAAPVAVVALFAMLSCWHFGMAHLDADDPGARWPVRAVAAVARGGLVLGIPLVAWPDETADVVRGLVRLAVPHEAVAGSSLSSGVVSIAGLACVIAAVAAVAVEGRLTTGRPRGGWRLARLLVDLGVIGCLGWSTDPLFSVGLYFLVWHGWRQMEPLATSLTGAAPRSWLELGRAVVGVHAAAVPLLVPTWGAIAAAWWLWSPDRSPRDLAILSIGAYVVVTPAHELLGDLLRATASDDLCRSHRLCENRPPRGSRIIHTAP